MPVAGLILSLLGLLFSLLMSFDLGPELLCLTSGCTAVRDFKILGISPWWASSAIFLIIALLCFCRLRLFANILCILFLLGDCLLLTVMLFIAPCSSCLAAGVIIFLTWLALRMERRMLVMPRRILAGTLGGLWSLLFVLNLGAAVNELAPTWSFAPDGASGKISIFFSPSCPACLEAVKTFFGQAVFFPVAENEDDYAIIADLAERTAAGTALDASLAYILDLRSQGAYTPPRQSPWGQVFTRIRIMRNQAAMLRLNYNTIPLFVLEGLPRAWVGKETAGAAGTESGAAQKDTPGAGVDLHVELGDTLSCGPDANAACNQ
jgi:hypothetical protein